jgi:hypothetical protein
VAATPMKERKKRPAKKNNKIGHRQIDTFFQPLNNSGLSGV